MDNNFCVQNEIFDRDISGSAKLVYTYLSKCADCFGKSWPAHKTIAASCSLSVTAVKAALSELKEDRILTITAKYRANGGKSSNIYMIMDRSFKNAFWASPEIFTVGSISAKAKLVYMYFCRCSNQEGECFPAHRKIAEKCTMALSTCRKAKKELLDSALIAITTRARKDNGQTSNLYTVVKSILDKVGNAIENVKAAATNLKNTTVNKQVDKNKKAKSTPQTYTFIIPQSQNSREHSHKIAGGLLKYAYERTKLKLRKYITKENK